MVCAQTHADLIISEVYFDSTDERVEIYNTWSDVYSWNITLSGAKASTVNIANLSIAPNQAVVVGDLMNMVTNSSVIARSWLSLNFPDTQAINVRIISWTNTVSTFTVDTGTMSTAKLTNASIHKNLADNNIYIAQDPYISNSAPGHPSNPWVVYNWFIGTEAPDLVISEVYFEWADERFELTNKGSQDFSGELTIQWLSNQPLTISLSIAAQASKVVADTTSSFIDTSMVIVSPQNLIIPDDGNIQAILTFQSQIVDTFDVAEDLVAPYIDGHNSFEKVRYNDQLQITVTTGDRVSNVPVGIIANPGIIFTVNDQVINIGDQEPTDSGSWDVQAPTYCTSLGSEIQVSEVFFGSGSYTPYIELYIPTTFNQNITLSGSLLNTSMTISVSEEAGDYFLVSSDTAAYIDSNSLHDNQELSLRWELGNLIIYGQNWQVLDIVDIRTLGGGNGVVFSSSGDCQRVFDRTTTISPWFDERFLQYKPAQIVVYAWGGWGGGSCPSDTPDNTPEDNPDIDSVSGIDIIDVVYDPFGSDTDRETITLTSLFTTDFDLKQARMAVSTRSWTQSLSGILYAGQTQVFTGNFRFPNTSACISLLTSTQIFDTYCYPTTGTAFNSTTWSMQMTGVATPIFTWYFDIVDIVYDPNGNDANNETITFATSGFTIDAETKLIIGTRNFSMDDYIGFYSWDITLTGNFRFPNSIATCVSRVQGIDVIDTYCYDPFAPSDQAPPNIHIKSIVYDPPGSDFNAEQIALELISPTSVDLSTLRLRIGTRNASIHGVLTTWSIQTFTDNFRFPNYDACVSLMFEDSIIDTLCYHANGNEDPLNNREQATDYTDASMDITDIVYDPPGSDTNKEELHITVNWDPIDLSDDFYLMINGTKRYLSSFGSVQGDEILVGNFRFPNNKDTCVSIQRQDRIFDTYCYISQEMENTWEMIESPTDYAIHIVGLVPNPLGKDENAETITLLLSWSLPIDLSQGFNLYVNKTKKKIAGILLPWQEQTIMGNFRFPNTASCISLEKNGIVFDRFCYENTQEGDIFTTDQGVLKQVSTVDLSILQKSQLTRFANKLCITYDDAVIKCKNAPLKVSPTNELKLYKSYVSLMHDYLMGDRNILFYNSPLVVYKTIFDTAKQDLKDFKSFVLIQGTRVPVYDVSQRFALQYQQAFVDSFADGMLSHILGDQWQKQLSIFRDQRFASLMHDNT